MGPGRRAAAEATRTRWRGLIAAVMSAPLPRCTRRAATVEPVFLQGDVRRRLVVDARDEPAVCISGSRRSNSAASPLPRFITILSKCPTSAPGVRLPDAHASTPAAVRGAARLYPTSSSQGTCASRRRRCPRSRSRPLAHPCTNAGSRARELVEQRLRHHGTVVVRHVLRDRHERRHAHRVHLVSTRRLKSHRSPFIRWISSGWS